MTVLNIIIVKNTYNVHIFTTNMWIRLLEDGKKSRLTSRQTVCFLSGGCNFLRHSSLSTTRVRIGEPGCSLPPSHALLTLKQAEWYLEVSCSLSINRSDLPMIVIKHPERVISLLSPAIEPNWLTPEAESLGWSENLPTFYEFRGLVQPATGHSHELEESSRYNHDILVSGSF
jgi:hypothetical protein